MHKGPSDFSHAEIPVTGILITNLGSPDEPTPASVRRYLKEFLWDPRVVEIPRPLWWVILHAFILTIRPAKSARAYRKVWRDEGSPLLYHSLRQRDALQNKLAERFSGPVKVVLGMRYGNPSIASALQQLRAANAQRILVLPLYPQHSAATTGSTLDALAMALEQWRYIPDLRFIASYHDDRGYVGAVTESVARFWSEHGRAQRLLFSFHGMPKRTLLAGDPYYCHCRKTARLVAEQLRLQDDEWLVAFQSRFGREEWLQPYADETLETLGAQGLQSLDVVCPGFSADCLETLEEMAMQNKEVFQRAGGGAYRYIPALNESPGHIDALAELVAHNAQGWPELEGWSRDAADAQAEQRSRLAAAAGAPSPG
jgi:ferrochelatase